MAKAFGLYLARQILSKSAGCRTSTTLPLLLSVQAQSALLLVRMMLLPLSVQYCSTVNSPSLRLPGGGLLRCAGGGIGPRVGVGGTGVAVRTVVGDPAGGTTGAAVVASWTLVAATVLPIVGETPVVGTPA